MKSLAVRYEQEQPVGAAYISGCFGALFFKPLYEDSTIFQHRDIDYIVCWHNGSNRYGYHRHEVHFSQSGRAYICKGNMRIYLDEVMRV